MDELKKKLREAEAKNRHLVKALQFYADANNWYIGDSFKQSCRIIESDLEYFPHGKTSDLIGGKMARQFLKDTDVLSESAQLIK